MPDTGSYLFFHPPRLSRRRLNVEPDTYGLVQDVGIWIRPPLSRLIRSNHTVHHHPTRQPQDKACDRAE
jgi:hypothetical protein